MVLDQDKDVEVVPEETFIYILRKSTENASEIYAGYVVDGAGGPDLTYIAKAMRLLLQKDEEPVKRRAMELNTNQPGYLYTSYTDPEEAKLAIKEIVPDSDEGIYDFFKIATERKKESFNPADYLPKTTETNTKEAESINPEEEA